VSAARLLAGAVVATVLFVVGQPAHAADHRPCISKVEYQSPRALPRADLENRWEVRDMGHREWVIGLDGYGWPVVAYPRCGYSWDEAWYGVTYDHGVAFAVTAWKSPSATAHGRP